ncbi:MAG: mechanosensitive ion channel [Thermoplasmata archaeon]|nr:mechanosensitive ion channel [Thermoplasmata archaeon]
MDKAHWSVLTLILVFVMIAAGSSGDGGTDENLNVFNRSSLTVDAHYPDASHFDFVIVNNNTMIYYIVNLSSNVTDATFSSTENHFVVEPKSVKEVKVEIKPYKRVPKKNCTITFEIRNAVNLSQIHTFVFHVEINYVGVVATEKVIGIFENFLPYPFNNVYGVFILDIVLWSVLIIVIYYLTETIIARMVKRTKTDLDDRILAIVRKPLLVFFITYAIVSSTEILDLPDVFYFYLYNFYWSVVILLFGYMAYRLWKDVIVYFFSQVAQKTETEIDDILVPVFDKVGGAVIVVVILIYFVNRVFSVDVTLLVASMGVLGLIIGFAAQDSLSNFFSGVLLMLDRPFAEGDIITLGDPDKWYRVERIGLRSTRFYSIFEDVMVVIPNNKLSSERIVNIVEPGATLRGRVDFSVSYGSDPQKVLKVAEEVALAHPDVVKDKKNAPVVRFRNFGNSSLDFAIFFLVKDYNQKYRVESEIRTNLFARFKKEGIEIPFPQLDVHIKNGKGG